MTTLVCAASCRKQSRHDAGYGRNATLHVEQNAHAVSDMALNRFVVPALQRGNPMTYGDMEAVMAMVCSITWNRGHRW